jgi:hypothetical protein
MLILTGKIVIINKVDIVNKSNNEVFHKVYLVVNKQMNKVKRNICFESYGKVANQILTYRKGQRVRISFTIDSTMNGTKWFHTLKVVEVEPCIKVNKTNNDNQINLINTDYDTT